MKSPASTGNNESDSESTLLVESEVEVLSIEQLNRQIRQLIEGQLGLVWVRGEISNFKAHTSGHFYFSLKDAKSTISAVMFRGHNSRLKFKPTDGLEVIVRGRVTVYEPRGNYQIVAELMEPVGAGALQKAFEQLKTKLRAEGLFDAARKRALPPYPRHIAIVTSPTGAAIKDMMNVLARRNKMVPVTLVPTIVQGEGAAAKIIDAMSLAERLPEVDVIIVGRGGGSIEDLWAFNDEALARKIASCKVPVISAVGHEIDFSISDFVADLRAPTPSAAAELVVKNSVDLVQKLETQERLLRFAQVRVFKALAEKLLSLKARLIDPKRRLQDLALRNDELQSRLINAQGSYLRGRRKDLQITQQRLVSPTQVLANYRQRIDMNLERVSARWAKLWQIRKSALERSTSLLDSLSPLRVVDRGYSLVMRDKAVIKSVKQLNVGDRLSIQLSDGEIEAEVKKISNKQG